MVVGVNDQDIIQLHGCATLVPGHSDVRRALTDCRATCHCILLNARIIHYRASIYGDMLTQNRESMASSNVNA